MKGVIKITGKGLTHQFKKPFLTGEYTINYGPKKTYIIDINSDTIGYYSREDIRVPDDRELQQD